MSGPPGSLNASFLAGRFKTTAVDINRARRRKLRSAREGANSCERGSARKAFSNYEEPPSVH
eukprot:15462210-Alexandrium_andersonii.AAC.1